MSVGKLITGTGKFVLNRVFGVMTQRQMLAATTKVGRGITEAAAKGDLSAELAGSIIKKALPKGVKAPDLITSSKKVAEDWFLQTGLVDDISKYRRTIQMAGGFSNLNLKTAESILYVNPLHFNGNLAAHELKHHLDSTASIKGKIKSFLSKLFFKSEKVQSRAKQFSPIMQKKYEKLELMIAQKDGMLVPHDLTKLMVAPTKAGLLSHLGVAEQDLNTYLTGYINNLLTDVSRKDGINILKSLIYMAKKEKMGYHAGAKITRALAHIKKGESCYSDMTSVFHDELIKVLKQALKQERKAYYKGVAGFKVPKRELVKAELKCKSEVDPTMGLLRSTRVKDVLERKGKTVGTEIHTADDGTKFTVEIMKSDKTKLPAQEELSSSKTYINDAGHKVTEQEFEALLDPTVPTQEELDKALELLKAS